MLLNMKYKVGVTISLYLNWINLVLRYSDKDNGKQKYGTTSSI